MKNLMIAVLLFVIVYLIRWLYLDQGQLNNLRKEQAYFQQLITEYQWEINHADCGGL